MAQLGPGSRDGGHALPITEAGRCDRQVAAAAALVEITSRCWALLAITWHLGRDGVLAGETGDGMRAGVAHAAFGAWAAVLDLDPAMMAGPPARPATRYCASGRWAGVMVSLTANCSGPAGEGESAPAPSRRAGEVLQAAQALARIVTAGVQAGAAIGWRLSPEGELTGTVAVPGHARRVREVFCGWEQRLGLGQYREDAIGDDIACRATASGAVDGVPVRLVATLWPDWPPAPHAGRRVAPLQAVGPRPPALDPPFRGVAPSARVPRP